MHFDIGEESKRSAFSGLSEAESRSYTKGKKENDAANNSGLCDKSLREDDLYKLKNTIMFEPSNLSVWQVLTMIMAIVVRFNLSDEIQQAIISLMKLAAGPQFKCLDTSKYLINKFFNPVSNAAQYVFYCPTCNNLLTNPLPITKNIKSEVTCDKCKKKYETSKKEGNFFVTVDLEPQLQNYLSTEYVRKQIQDKIENRSNTNAEHSISDVCDSDRYKADEFIQSKNDSDNVVLTLNVNLDGAPLFKSGKNSFWPIQCIINEIPQIMRHNFMLLAGLWYTSCEPKPEFMNLYLKSFITQIQKLTVTGLKVLVENGRVITYFVKIFSFPVDSVARPVLQNRLQFNGFYGCSWCYQRGQTSSRSMKYPLSSDTPRLRDHESYVKDVEKHKNDIKKLRKTKKNEKYTVFGIKGSSVLSSLSDFDCVWGFPHDYMHGVLLGVTRQLWNKWSKEFLSVDQRKLINARLTAIQPPNEIHRTPQILLKRKSWKATEWRSWLLFYSVPVLSGILRQDLLDSYKLLVKSIFKLLSVNLTENELLQCEMDLLKFVYDCQNLYGISFITFNVHSLLHIVDSVRKNGPSWATSTYAFENNIYNLKLQVSGPNGVLGQMAIRTLRSNNFQKVLATESNETCRQFSEGILNKKRPNVSKAVESDNGALLMDHVNEGQLENSAYSIVVVYFKKRCITVKYINKQEKLTTHLLE
ncbi:Protein of unknown function [Cotesia congregata]|uniref:Uncharacterized protein n=1 Tax=Cotesia congregata TaxID=51543 RepID=A0A8J2MID3_COTCN|nr:Protein of unknown function [Cotesia congregata]